MNLRTNGSLVASQRDILGIPVCDLDWAAAFDFAARVADLPVGQTTIAFLNANNANLMLSDAEYRNALERQLVLPDGHGVDIASKLLHGHPFPANLNGTDFVPALLTYMETPKRIALIGAERDVLLRAAEKFKAHTPWHEFQAVSDGFFDRSKSDAVMAKVRELQPDILLVAMGSPVQEKWIDRHVTPGHARLVISVGALFDFVAGRVPRAPVRMRRFRLEWLYRLMQEPQRLWYRYIVGNPLFLYRVARYKLQILFGRRRNGRA
ncbi:WecB/TagA/CpsF family glycosyltransferase [Mycoplana dimorpha]|uniref:Exopolysaccharide biosynthesis WecB/TagA/CpsF family protein n=1 Tax=Mycoplana dimorpha TaxID=28320 RepID=A0A2T5BFH3_MYCDI|nr:WecB/TagA/CpsF family glycosyltransferase [Mycoplana dimorpha]PTM97725.1 exopolysaccharide biosynthesis WecB/TagA/CpsF family protein [Mycoplana dimorpha]